MHDGPRCLQIVSQSEALEAKAEANPCIGAALDLGKSCKIRGGPHCLQAGAEIQAFEPNVSIQPMHVELLAMDNTEALEPKARAQPMHWGPPRIMQTHPKCVAPPSACKQCTKSKP